MNRCAFEGGRNSLCSPVVSEKTKARQETHSEKKSESEARYIPGREEES